MYNTRGACEFSLDTVGAPNEAARSRCPFA